MLQDFVISIPPLQQQIAIVNFLNNSTSKIDTLIQKQQNLIELLKEKRQALISHAVTKGLNPHVKMKDSGVEWLGKIPEHWESVCLKWIAKIYSGGTPDKTNLSYWEEGTIPWISSGEVNQFFITEPTTYITEEAYEKSSAKWIPKNALVMALAGQGKTKGMVAQLGIMTTCNQSMAAIVLSEKVSERFIFWWLTSNYEKIRNLAGGDLRDGLNLDIIGSIVCPYFLLSEQQQIANYLDKSTCKIDTLISKAQKAIELLKERRTALISAAVTGKIDVRSVNE
ncbi:MAG: restriction endonuclease subunit S [Sulfurospirillum sp.]|nr:restriction endonuclease subunit S [Sulfurospirillum sp.]